MPDPKQEEDEPRSPGAKPERLKIDAPFEEAIARLIRSPIPPGGVPDREPRRKRRGSPKKPDAEGVDGLRGTVEERGDVVGPTGEEWDADK